MQCKFCGSDHVQRLSVVYDGGTEAVHSESYGDISGAAPGTVHMSTRGRTQSSATI